MKKTNKEITDAREYQLVYQYPLFSRYKCKFIKLNQRDLLAIIRQIKNEEVKEQLKSLITAIDEEAEYRTDIEGQAITKEKLMKKHERLVENKDIDLRLQHA